jgi:hypothetical protein
MMEHMSHFNGLITYRNFRQYLITQRLKKETELRNLLTNLEEILLSFNSNSLPNVVDLSVEHTLKNLGIHH